MHRGKIAESGLRERQNKRSFVLLSRRRWLESPREPFSIDYGLITYVSLLASSEEPHSMPLFQTELRTGNEAAPKYKPFLHQFILSCVCLQ